MELLSKNKMLACLWLELITDGKIEEICSITSPTWRMHGGPPAMPAGHEGVRFLFGTFDDIQQRWTVDQIIAEGNKVVIRAMNSCMQNSFFGIPASGKQQVFACTFIFLIVDGLIQETWRNADDLGRLLQIGARLMPPLEPAKNP
jgi:hypothetical protein